MEAIRLLVKLLTLAIGCIENVIHGGVIYGWASLVFTLKQEGYFSDLCRSISGNNVSVSPFSNHNFSTATAAGNVAPSCDEQDARLQLVYTIASSVVPISMFPTGILLDKLGMRVTRSVLSVLMLFGYLLMGFSSPQHSIVLFPGTIMFTIGGIMLLMCDMELGNLFRNRKSTAITLVIGSNGISVVVLLLVKIAYEAGFPISTSFFILAGSTALLNINTFIFLPSYRIPWPLPKSYRLVHCGICGKKQESQLAMTTTPPLDNEQNTYANQGYVQDDVNLNKNEDCEISDSINKKRKDEIPPCEVTAESEEMYSTTLRRREFSSLSACIKSLVFWLILLWQVILEVDFLFAFGTVNTFLTRLAQGDNDIVSWYTNIFTIIQMLIIVVAPLGGLLMDRNKGRFLCFRKEDNSRGPSSDIKDSCIPLALGTLASIGYSVCLLIPSLPLQYVTFVLILIVRSLLYGVGSAVVAIIFPKEYYASVYGAIRTLSGLVALLQYPLFILIQNILNNDPFYVTIGFIVADSISFLLPAYLFITSKKKDPRGNKLIKPVI